jgi:phospholipid-binding lipoprotein MlaA
LLLFFLGGCAAPANRADPLEPLNRTIFKLNDTMDEAIFKPVAKGYKTAIPKPIRTGVTNFFSNIADVFIAVNNLLQGKPEDAASDVCRVIANTTFGILGIFDVATSFGHEKHDEDFGQTLGRWGFGSGAYLVLPFFGPRTVRDSVGLAVDLKVDPVTNIGHVPTRNTAVAVRTIDTRANLLDVSDILDEAALDRYVFVRNAYLQRRKNLIYDGEPPRESNVEEDEKETNQPSAEPKQDAKPAN